MPTSSHTYGKVLAATSVPANDLGSGDMIQEPLQTDPPPKGNGNAGVEWIRVFAWIMPTAFVWGFVVLMGLGFALLRRWGVIIDFRDAQGFLVVFWVAGSIVGVLGIGYLDARLKRQQGRISQADDRFDDGWHVLKFFLFQLALIPILSITVSTLIWMVAPLAGR
ncbi:MAG: hypothetical protein EOP87_01500 [Verrucomicrobiaceae bacterium]|nr:MAG: hypothetical protein EOP87_01500 [Verrucomicrobiaceae bacterium]